jgi:uncharacterized protein YjbI with pentapeptide repeats
VIEIRDLRGNVIRTVDAESLYGANLRSADLCDANLYGANLRSADLCGADLCGADLCRANLRGASLCSADLTAANLRSADLSGADLRSASLRGADLTDASLIGADLRVARLYGADLCGASLRGARINWQSHRLLAEILRQAAATTEQRKWAGLVMLGESEQKCWRWFLALDTDPLFGWAMSALRVYVQADDGAPRALRDWPMPQPAPDDENKE